MEINELPKVLTSLIASESCDFAVKAGAKRPFVKCAGEIAFGLLFTSATLIFVFIFLLSRNPAEAEGTSILESAKGLIVLFGVFLTIGITIMVYGVIRAFSRGGYFVGTPKRLISYRKENKYSSFEWNRFAGDIQVKGNARKATIRLFMRPENLARGESEEAYLPGIIYITSIRDAHEIEKLIRRRIKENDPTPAVR